MHGRLSLQRKNTLMKNYLYFAEKNNGRSPKSKAGYQTAACGDRQGATK
jgi:hypothetical protein